MQIFVNGEPRTIGGSTSVDDLLRLLAIPAERVAVEINETVVARDTFATHRLAGGDRVEIVHFVGGGL